MTNKYKIQGVKIVTSWLKKKEFNDAYSQQFNFWSDTARFTRRALRQ